MDREAAVEFVDLLHEMMLNISAPELAHRKTSSIKNEIIESLVTITKVTCPVCLGKGKENRNLICGLCDGEGKIS